jgi:CMP/dCMP kinase
MDISNKLIIAIDGFSSCGKSTLAKDLAKKLNYIYIDSGAMYRAITLFCIQNSLIEDDKVDELKLKSLIHSIHIEFKVNQGNGNSETYLNGELVEDEIREIEVSQNVSLVSKIGFVREYLVELQREIGKNKGIVMDGRDIGTVVFPNADYKIFVTAQVDVRADRRFKELSKKGVQVNYEEIKKNIEERDYIDQNRDISPLKKADDAIMLDNSHMTVEEQLEWAIQQFNFS